jgi:hypothetical protein
MFMPSLVDLAEGPSSYFLQKIVLQFGVAIFLDHYHVLIEKDGLLLDRRPFCSDTLDTHFFINSIRIYIIKCNNR